jgi:hypothetical protein
MNVRPHPGALPVPSGCELCGEKAARELYTAKDRLRNSEALFLIVECSGCRVLRTLPEMTDAELRIFYPEQYWGQESEPEEKCIRSSQADTIRFETRPLMHEFRLKPGAAPPDVNPLNPKYRAFIAAWKRLPLPVANLLGPPIVKNLG